MQARTPWTIGVILIAAISSIAQERTATEEAEARSVTTQSHGFDRAALTTLSRPPATGLFVFEVLPGSTAQKAGIRVGDILTHYDGQAVETHLDLTRLARIVNDEKRDEILLVIHRQGREIDLTVPPGPMGVRLEDVAAGEERILPGTSPGLAESDYSWLERIIASGGQRWMLVFAEGRSQPIGWVRHTFAKRSADEGSLEIRQYLQQSQAVVRQEILLVFSLDPYLTIRQMRLSANDKLVLDVRAERNQLIGTRAGVPVESPLLPQTVSAYLAPYAAMGGLRSGQPSLSCRYLPPGSLESAPYSEIVVQNVPSEANGASPEASFVVRKLGRDEMNGSIDRGGELRTLHLRGGLRMAPASEQEVGDAFPQTPTTTTMTESSQTRN